MVRVSKTELHRAILEIMRKGNLDQLTTKKIRILCEEKYSIDLSSRREEIDKIVMAFVKKKSGTDTKDSNESSNDESSSYESDEGSSCSSGSGSESCTGSECSYSGSSEESIANTEVANKVLPKAAPKKQPEKKVVLASQKRNVTSHPDNVSAGKKPKKDVAAEQIELDDAAYARQLQAEEWNFRQRTVKKLFPPRSPQKKNAKTDQNKRKKASPFTKKCSLSPALAEILGVNEMSRPEVVQKMWSIVKERNLFDTANRQYAFCDKQMMKVFGKKRIRLIGMMKYLKHHIKDIK